MNQYTLGEIMKDKIKKILFIVTVLLILPGSILGNRLIQERGIYPNHSAEYVRTLNRSASTEADAAFYNPAGLVFMQNTGLYIMVSGQTYWARKTHSMDYYAIEVGAASPEMTYHSKDSFTGNLPKEYFAETVAPILPDINIVYSAKNWAVYLDVSILQAAPSMKFPLGLAIIDWGNLAEQETLLFGQSSNFIAYNSDAEAIRTEYVIGGTIGGVYKINNWFSVALGGRYMYAFGSMSIQVKNISFTKTDSNGDNQTEFGSDWDINTEYQGHGGSIIAGCHFNFENISGNFPKILKPLNIGVKIEYHFPIVLKKTTNSFKAPATVEASGSLNLFKDGTPGSGMTYLSGNGESTFTFQYPAQFNIGISYKLLKNLKLEASGEITLRKARDMSGDELDYKDIGYKVGFSVEWGIMKNLIISLGYLYNDFGVKEDARDAADMMLPSHTVGGGLSIEISKRLIFTFGIYYELYVSQGLYVTEYTNVSDPTYHYLYKEFNENRMSVAWGVTYRFLGDSDSAKQKDKNNKQLKLNF
ncbi:MAG: hypothetical protein PF450_04150 [Bacteroidales bacterium]|nr:hypothetical protein [Bacteroidales bacterium]